MGKWIAGSITAALALAALALLPGAAVAVPVQLFQATGALEASDPDQTGRITNGTGKTSCVAPTTATLNTAVGARNYDAYTLANNLTAPACMEVTVAQSCGPAESLQHVAHLDFFDPANPLLNHLGDGGGGFGGAQTQSFGFNVPAGRRFVVKVNVSNADTTCAGGYTLTVTSDPGQPTGAPTTQLLAGPTGDQVSTQAEFAFASDRTAATFECSLDDAPFAACGSPASLDGLGVGPHVFQVRAVDPNTTTDATPATRAFEVVEPAPPDRRPRIGLQLLRPEDFGAQPRLTLFLTSDEPATQVASATVNVPRATAQARAAKVFRFRRARVQLEPGEIERVRLRLTGKGKRAAQAALRRGKGLAVRVKVKATDADGQTSVARRRVRVTG